MAGDTVNGNAATHQQDVHSIPHENASAGEPASSMPGSGAPINETDEKPPTKEEIGWFFVEQYYKTLCNEPGKLYLYYNKRSQFVSGDEAEKVQVAVGQKAISERIKQLDIQDCKVRVLNVDSQESLKNILVQVIGEMSNKAEPHRKFVQTFVLAEQPSGYYVLNDVFRYIILDEEEFENGTAPTNDEAPSSVVPDTTTLTSSNNEAQKKADVDQLDKKLEKDVLQKSSSDLPAATNGDSAKPHEDDTHNLPAAADKKVPAEEEEMAGSSAPAIAEEAVQPEKPRDPEPTPVASPPKQASATPAPAPAPAGPAKPKTWANLVAAKSAASTASNGTAPSAAAPTSQVKPKVAAAPSNKASAPAATSNGDESPSKTEQNGNAGWQMAGPDNKQRQGRGHSQSVSSSQEVVSGYVKNVTDKVDASILKQKLSSFGPLKYFDVSRPKNCAFVEFSDNAAYNAAVAANPHSIGGEQIFVEERRPRAGAFGGSNPNRGGMRGGRYQNDGRPAGNQGRGGFNKDGGRGGYAPRGGRGGAMPSKNREQQPQAA